MGWRSAVRWLVAGGCALWLAACQSPVVQPEPQAPEGLSPAQVQVLREHGFEDAEGAWTLQVPSKLLFPVDTDQLDAQQAKYVMQLARDLQQVGIYGVRVEGHTDDTGAAQYNQQLSERRAQRVAELLVRGGMDSNQVRTWGWGNTKPLPMAVGHSGRRENRRVSIIIPSTAPH